MDCAAMTPTASPGCTMERYHLTCIRRWKSAGGGQAAGGRGSRQRRQAGSRAITNGHQEKQRLPVDARMLLVGREWPAGNFVKP